MLKIYLIVAIAMAAALSSCRHHPDSVDVVSGATIPHDQIILPPTNSHYQVLGHREGLNGYVVKYDDAFYRGGQVYIEDLAAEALQEYDIKTIVSITPSDAERAFCAANGFALIEIPFDKSGPSVADYQNFIQALETSAPPYYIHCKGGSHRAGILSAAYRIQLQDWSLEQALLEYGRLGGDLKSDHAMLETLRVLTPASKK
jgi:protein tyrosine phosphatase (PTP) superfamily phosphohydrolase (DUF442 family)